MSEPSPTGTARRRPRFVVPALLAALAVGLGACQLVTPLPTGGGGTVTFTERVIDGRDLGADVKAVGDIDGDGDKDVVIGDDETAYLQWYAAPSWTV